MTVFNDAYVSSCCFPIRNWAHASSPGKEKPGHGTCAKVSESGEGTEHQASSVHVSEAEGRNLSGLRRNQHSTPILKGSSKKGNLAAESRFQRNPTGVSGSFDAFHSLSSVKRGWWWINNEGEMLLGQLKQTFQPPGDPFGYHGNNCGKQKSRWHSLTRFKCKFCG